MKAFYLTALVVLGLAGLAAPAVRADIYSFTDAHGVVHFTNMPVDRRWELVKNMPRSEDSPEPEGLPKEKRYEKAIRKHATNYAVDPAFVKAVMKVESDFDPGALSEDGAIGLMQLMPETAERLGVRNPYDPADNIHGGVKFLSSLIKQYGSLHLAAAAYNAGEKAVERYGGIPPYNETRRYVQKVIHNYDLYRQGLGKEKSAPEVPENRVSVVKRKDGVTIYTNIPYVYEGLQDR